MLTRYNLIEKILIEKTDCACSLPFVVAIDGMSGSGKSTLADYLHHQFPDSNLFHMDDFFLRPEQRTQERLQETGGNVDYERFKDEIVSHLADRDGLSFRRYNCKEQALEDSVHISWKPLVIIEGSYSHHPYFKDYCNLRIFLEVSSEEQKERILARNGEFMLGRFLNEWIPKEHAYFETFHIKESALCL